MSIEASTFSLSATAGEIRAKFPEKYGKVHDDYLCLAEFTSDASMHVTIESIDFNAIGDVGPLTKALYERIFSGRKTLLGTNTLKAQLDYTELKKRLAELMKTEPALQEIKENASTEFSTVFDLISTMDALRSSINTYYKLKSEEPSGQQFFEELGQTIFLALRSLDAGVAIGPDIFTERTMFMRDKMLMLSDIFSKSMPHVRQELIVRFRELMRSILACFVLYRIPVSITSSQRPVYFSRFIPFVKLKPFLDMYGLELGAFTLSA